MKEQKDILDVFDTAFEKGFQTGNSDWVKISVKNARANFWKWLPTQLNAYYVGLILISFIGTFVIGTCLLYTSPSPRDGATSRMPSSA